MQNKSDKLIDRVSALLRKADDEVKAAFHGGVIEFKKQFTEANLNFELVDRYGGEDQGSDYWSVYSFTDGMQVVFIKFDGYYASYDGSTYEEFYEVQPIEKTITVFKKK